jgi:hypothetical protein
MIAVIRLAVDDRYYICGIVKEYSNMTNDQKYARVSFGKILWVSGSLNSVDDVQYSWSNYPWLVGDIMFIDKFSVDAVKKVVSIMEV